MIYGRCSKILNAICLPKGPRQTVQTQIRLLLKKQSDEGLSLFAILTSILWIAAMITNILNVSKEVFKTLEHLLYIKIMTYIFKWHKWLMT